MIVKPSVDVDKVMEFLDFLPSLDLKIWLWIIRESASVDSGYLKRGQVIMSYEIMRKVLRPERCSLKKIKEAIESLEHIGLIKIEYLDKLGKLILTRRL